MQRRQSIVAFRLPLRKLQRHVRDTLCIKKLQIDKVCTFCKTKMEADGKASSQCTTVRVSHKTTKLFRVFLRRAVVR